MNKFIVKPNKTLEEIIRLNKKSRIVLEPKERFINPYKEFDFERPRKLDHRDWIVYTFLQDLKNKQN